VFINEIRIITALYCWSGGFACILRFTVNDSTDCWVNQITTELIKKIMAATTRQTASQHFSRSFSLSSCAPSQLKTQRTSWQVFSFTGFTKFADSFI